MSKMEKSSKLHPLLAKKLVERFTVFDDEFNIGDTLQDLYMYKHETEGRRKANLWYWRQVLFSIPKHILSRFIWSVVMFKNYLKITVRDIIRHKGYSSIHIVGLAVGMACFLLITMWVMDELSYDRFHEDVDNIYQAMVHLEKNTSQRFPNIPYPFAPEVEEKIPEVVETVRLEGMGRILLSNQNDKFYEPNMIVVDPTFFKLFSFQLLQGNPASALANPFSVVITETMAKKYFPDQDPMGQVLRMNNQNDLIITGIVKDVKNNSTILFDFIAPLELRMLLLQRRQDHWGRFSTTTFLKLRPDCNIENVKMKAAYLLNEHLLKQGQLLEKNVVTLLPFAERYFFFVRDKTYIYLFSTVAFFILMIACCNFINLSTARSSIRMKEIGLRKVTGASRGKLVVQFLSESVVQSCIAVVFSFLIVIVLFPVFNHLTGKELVFNLPFVITIFIILAVFIGIAGGIYPSLILSALHPASVLKGPLASLRKGLNPRRALVVVQFSLTISLIIGTMIIHRQMEYIRKKDIGYEKEHMIRIAMPNNNNYHLLKNELFQKGDYPGITGTLVNLPYFNWTEYGAIKWEGKDPKLNVGIGSNIVDFNFTETMEIELVEGRGFSSGLLTDINSTCLVNEEMVKLMGLDKGVGASIKYGSQDLKIIGVMKNFHFKPLRNLVEPLILRLNPNSVRSMLIRIKSENISSSLMTIKRTWQNIIPSSPLEYNFLDEEFDRAYKNFERMGLLIDSFTLLAVFIACIGLFGLTSFSIQQRTKEIGIRKVVGASVFKLVLLLMKAFIKCVLIANLIAWPIAYFSLNNLLQDFAYKTEINIWLFIFSSVLAIVIAFLTVSYQTIKAAVANPVDSLRYE